MHESGEFEYGWVRDAGSAAFIADVLGIGSTDVDAYHHETTNRHGVRVIPVNRKRRVPRRSQQGEGP
jgi:hypothetical protein